VQVPQHCRWHTLASGRARLALVCGNQVLKSYCRFAEKIMKAAKGEKGIVEPTYVYLPGVAGGDAIAKEVGVDYFSVPVELGVCKGIKAVLESRLTCSSPLEPRKLPTSSPN